MPRHFRFDVLWLLSEAEGRGRKITWAKGTTALVGGNHTGKSTLLRMLFYAFGCKTRALGAEWDPRTVVAVTFSTGEARYTILRRGGVFSLFDSAGTLLWVTDDSGELRSRFSALTAFVLPMMTQQGDVKQARPPFFFLPSYIDQDGGWGHSWQTFDGLGEFREWQKPTIELMLGIRGSEYWETAADLSAAKRRAEDLEREERIVKDTRKRLSDKFPRRPWFRDALTFKRELAQLEARASSLSVQQQQLEVERTDLANAQSTLESQVALIDGALKEHAPDMQFLDERRREGEIVCPTCGTAHENSFHSRLNLEAEADDLRQLRAHFGIKLERIKKDVEVHGQKLADIVAQADEVSLMLESRRGELKLREIVTRAGAEQAHDALDEQSASIEDESTQAQNLVEALKIKLEELNDSARAREITRRFRQFYSHFAASLTVPGSLGSHSGAIHVKPRAGGSGGPRAILAYHFALAFTAEEFCQGCIPPIAIDSPHQQAQDEIRRPQVTEFIIRNRPAGQQLIVGLEDPPPTSVALGPDDVRIDLTEQFAMLSAAQYTEVLSFIGPLWHIASAAMELSET